MIPSPSFHLLSFHWDEVFVTHPHTACKSIILIEFSRTHVRKTEKKYAKAKITVTICKTSPRFPSLIANTANLSVFNRLNKKQQEMSADAPNDQPNNGFLKPIGMVCVREVCPCLKSENSQNRGSRTSADQIGSSSTFLTAANTEFSVLRNASSSASTALFSSSEISGLA